MYVTIHEAMVLLDVKRSTIYKLMKKYQIKTHRKPGKRQSYIKETDLLGLMKHKERS